jgi:hypothetical protein
MVWPAEYAREHGWLNPWPFKMLTPVVDWLPIKAPNDPWQVVLSPPAFDADGNRVAPKPPPGVPVYWWRQAKETWPYRDEMPWENKQFGAWPATQITMSDDLPPSIWPGPHRVHPFGFIKLKMDGEPDAPYTKGNQILAMDMHVHMRWISPDEIKVKTAITPMGPRYYIQSPNWEFKEYEYKQFRAELNRKRRERLVALLAEEMANYNGEPKPSKDLFS